MRCGHENVAVDYDHPHGLIAGVLVSSLRTSDPKTTRAKMTLRSPRCLDCGRSLRKADLRMRIVEGGDLYDARFLWVCV